MMVRGKLINARIVAHNQNKYSFDNTFIILDDEVEVFRSEMNFPYTISDLGVQEIILDLLNEYAITNTQNASVDQNLQWDWFTDV